MTVKPAIFSFFSGSGFLDLGFENSGFDIVYVNEYHSPFMDAYKHSRKVLGHAEPRFGYDECSIEKVDLKSLSDNCRTLQKDGQIVGFIGGPPCPDFSVGGKNKGQDGENGKLSRSYVDLICLMKPDFFLFENVKGLYRTKKHREFFEILKSDLVKNGYHLHEKLVNSIEYGAAQDRDRIILLGFRDDALPEKFIWSERKFPERSAFEYPWPSRDSFVENNESTKPKDIPYELTISYWFERNDVDNHPNGKHCFKARAGLARFLTVDEGDDSRKSYKRLHRWRYSPTAAYGNNEVHLHPTKPRRITVAEALAIQSLPKGFELPADMSLSNMFKTVGNGVPYIAALGIAKSILNHLGVKDENNCAKSGSGDRQATAQC